MTREEFLARLRENLDERDEDDAQVLQTAEALVWFHDAVYEISVGPSDASQGWFLLGALYSEPEYAPLSEEE